jgi:hypothetical protein
MRDLDLDAVRKEIGAFTFAGKRHSVFQPTMRQILVHEDKLRQLKKDVERMEKKGGSQDDLDTLWREFLIFETCHFVPTLTRDEVMDMTPEQRAAIMGVVRGINPDEPEAPVSKKKTKKKTKKK